jgi:hypothetical protein
MEMKTVSNNYKIQLIMVILMDLETTSKNILEMTTSKFLKIKQIIYQDSKYFQAMIVPFPKSNIYNCKMN